MKGLAIDSYSFMSFQMQTMVRIINLIYLLKEIIYITNNNEQEYVQIKFIQEKAN